MKRIWMTVVDAGAFEGQDPNGGVRVVGLFEIRV